MRRDYLSETIMRQGYLYYNTDSIHVQLFYNGKENKDTTK